MPNRGLSLTGDWTGVYDYAEGAGHADAVPFVASLFDVAGAVWGTTEEPNTFAPGHGPDLTAEVNGTRSGRELRFRKVYHDTPPGGETPVDYAGHISPDGQRVEGRWQITMPGQVLTGAFVMDRRTGTRAVRVKAAETEVTVDS